MVRVPTKSCPSLSRLIDNAEPELLAAFLNVKSFARLDWLGGYAVESDQGSRRYDLDDILRNEKKDRLFPLETEAARVLTVAGVRGQYVLEGLSVSRLDPERARQLATQRDELARSLWSYIHEPILFEAVENTLHSRMYRRYDKHYQTFQAEPSETGGPRSGSEQLADLISDIAAELDRGDGYSIEKFDIPEDGDEPAAEMYLLFHPDPPTSVREIDEAGNRSRIYFRPSGEAMIVFTPSTGRVHVRARTRALRHMIARRFVETALQQPYSNQPVEFQAYAVSRFLQGFELSLPEVDDAVILRAQVIRADVSIGSLANRLSVSTTIDQDISALIESQEGLGGIFERALAIRFVEIAVRYRREGRQEEQTLDFSISDLNTSSLLSLDDPFERVLGHRLLRSWGILVEGRAPDDREKISVLPDLLRIWDLGNEQISGGWLISRDVDTDALVELGFLVPSGWEGDDVIDDEDEIGQVVAKVAVQTRNVELSVSEGHEAAGGASERYRLYRVRQDWVTQHLQEQLSEVLDEPMVEELTRHLAFLGSLEIDGRKVPIYLARSLYKEKIRSDVDTELRTRRNLGPGLVLNASKTEGHVIGMNVLATLDDFIAGEGTEIRLEADRLRQAFRRDELIARGGATVEFREKSSDFATLFVPGAGTIDITGANRILVIRRLVEAHHRGQTPIKTARLTEGIEDQSLANIFRQPLWKKLKADFLRSGKKGLWEFAL